MPRFFFNVYDGHSIQDAEGTELPGVDAATQEAILLAGALLREAGNGPMLDDWRIEVLDERGTICFALSLNLFRSAAVRFADDSKPLPPGADHI